MFAKSRGTALRKEALARGLSFPYLAEMYFIENNLIRVPYSPKSSDKSKGCYDYQGQLVVPFGSYCLRKLVDCLLE